MKTGSSGPKKFLAVQGAGGIKSFRDLARPCNLQGARSKKLAEQSCPAAYASGRRVCAEPSKVMRICVGLPGMNICRRQYAGLRGAP